MTVKSKLPGVGTTIFTVMSQLAVEHNAINLGQGFPDFAMDDKLVAQVNEAMRRGQNQYAPMAGLPLLRERIAEKVERLYGTHISADTEVTITPGGTYAIYTALTTVLHPGDEVIVFEPSYDSYVPNIVVNGAVPVYISLSLPDYRIPWNEVREKITARTRMIMINSPHNPTGMVLSAEDMMQLASIVAGTDIWVLSDEVYEHLIFDGIAHESVLKYPELLERSFVCFSFGKTYSCTGWKMGYCVAPAPLMAEFRKVHQFNIFSCNTPVQAALAAYMLNPTPYLKLGEMMQHKRDYLRQLMAETGLQPFNSRGSYFECYGYGELSDEGDQEFAIRMTKEAGVTAIPLSAFYSSRKDDKVLRFCFSKQNETLERAVERLRKFFRV